MRRPRIASPFRALAHRPFAFLWTGQLVSQLGDSVHYVALAWWVLEETGSATAMGTVLLFASVPHLLFLLVGGVAGDRYTRLHLMLASDVLRGLAVGIVALLAWQDALTLVHLCALSAIFGVTGAFFSPAFSAAIPDLVPPERLPSANALRSFGGQFSAVVGPALAGVLVAGGGTTVAFALDAASFVVSALCVTGAARAPSLRKVVPAEAGFLPDLRLGIATVFGSRWLWMTIAIAGISNLTLVGPMATSLPLLIETRFAGNAWVYGALQSLAAVGSIAAAAWLGSRSVLRRRGPLVYVAWIVDALMLAVIGLPAPLVVAAVAMLIFGFAETMVGLVWMTTLQDERIVPPDRLGRVVSIDEFGSYALFPVSFALAGIASDQFGPGPVFVLGGILGAAVVALGLLAPEIRRLD